MRVGICEWTTFPASFAEELAAYRAAGAGVELMSDDGTFGNAFEDSLWALPTEELARRSVESLEALL